MFGFPKQNMGAQQQQGGAAPAPAPAPAEASGKGKSSASRIDGGFDPEPLLQGAEAMKRIRESPDAEKAYKLMMEVELRKREEAIAKQREQQTMAEQYKQQLEQMKGETKRKSEEEERRTAQYRAELESQLYQKKLEDQQKQAEMSAEQQYQQFLRQEEARKRTEAEIEAQRRQTLQMQKEVDVEVARARAYAEAEAKAKSERENVDIRLRTMLAEAQEKRKQMELGIELMWRNISDPARRAALLTIVGGSFVLFFSAKYGGHFAKQVAERHFFKPAMVRETSRRTFTNWLSWAKPQSNKEKLLDNIVLDKELHERLQWTTNRALGAKQYGLVYSNVLLYGPPGTGKTLFARTLARQSGLDYAILSGGDVGSAGTHAVEAMRDVFKWAETSKKGMILFIDEADAFLHKGRETTGGMGAAHRDALSAFLELTGTESKKIMVVLASNVRDLLDRAVLDRCDEQFELALPSAAQRETMWRMFLKNHVLDSGSKPVEVDEDVCSDDFAKYVAAKTEGFSGRQMAKLAISMHTAAMGSGTYKLTTGMARTVLEFKKVHQDV